MALFEIKRQAVPKTLSDKYVVPPFSVFNTHQPYMKKRMVMWRDMGMCGTNGRQSGLDGLSYDNRRMDKNKTTKHNGTSTFNPVVCEVVYKWFTTPNSNVFDPFAGGITRGAIASILGHNYIGYDINPKQIKSNQEEYKRISERYMMPGDAKWMCKDSFGASYYKADLVFTCPPYFNLETYTDIDGDLSREEDYDGFLVKYAYIISHCYDCLNDDSFMVWVVSDVRSKNTGEYYGLVADTIKIAQESGLKFYNEIILYNETGNLAITSGDYLQRARKVGRQHQNILVFYKGNTRNIKEKFGEI